MKYKTDPLCSDTDGGLVDDWSEVTHGTDPLNPNDDIVLERVFFDINKAKIAPYSREMLGKIISTLKAYTEIEIEIQGHTCGNGSYKSL